MNGQRGRQQPGVFAPTIDRTRCEGGFHGACADAGCPCVTACPDHVLEVLPLSTVDKRQLTRGGRFRAWIHGNRQSCAVAASLCTACGACVKACPQHAITLKRRT